MSYTLNKTDGTILTELVDGILDTDTTDISLVGRNYTGYGEFVNENFIKMLENFANTTVPVAPLRGQLWYDTSLNKLKVYDGEEFVPATGSFVSTSQPQQSVAGDTWFDTSTNQLYLYDGTAFQLVGPQYTLQQGESGILVRTVQDTNLNSRTVLEVRVGDSLEAVISREEFTPNNVPGNIIPQLVTTENPTGRIFIGYNIVDPDNFIFRGSALRTERVVTPTGDEILATQIVRNDQDGIILGSLSIRSSAGVILGPSQNTRFIVQDGLTVQNTQVDDNMHFVVNSSTSPLSAIDAVTVLTQPQHVGIFNSSPEYTLDVDGDMRVTGDLKVEGDTFTVEVGVLTVEDKNIELAVSSDSGPSTDTDADGGGITLRGDTNKTLEWVLSTDSWTSSEHFDLAASKSYKINGSKVLDANRLYDSVTQATGLTQVGTLQSLTVDNISLDNSTISRINGTGLVVDAGTGDIEVRNSKITQVATPTNPEDAANKNYVDQQVSTDPLILSLDVTGWVVPDIRDERITTTLEAVFPATASLVGKEARVITFYYADQTVENINVAANVTKEFEPVLSNDTGSEVQVLEDVGFPTSLSGTYTPTVTREIRVYQIASVVGGTEWQFVSAAPIPAP